MTEQAKQPTMSRAEVERLRCRVALDVLKALLPRVPAEEGAVTHLVDDCFNVADAFIERSGQCAV